MNWKVFGLVVLLLSVTDEHRIIYQQWAAKELHKIGGKGFSFVLQKKTLIEQILSKMPRVGKVRSHFFTNLVRQWLFLRGRYCFENLSRQGFLKAESYRKHFSRFLILQVSIICWFPSMLRMSCLSLLTLVLSASRANILLGWVGFGAAVPSRSSGVWRSHH